MELNKGQVQMMEKKILQDDIQENEYKQMEMFPAEREIYEVAPFHDDYFRKSNFLISAKYRSTLLENKILTLGLVIFSNPKKIF